MAPFTLRIGDRDLTGKHDGLVLSNVDPGGYELLSCNPRLLDGIRPGAPVIARHGLTPIFWGDLNEPGQRQQGGRDSFSAAAFGPADRLRQTKVREIFVDGDLSHWNMSVSSARRASLVSGGWIVQDCGVLPGGVLVTPLIDRAWGTGPEAPVGEAWYDSHGIPVGSLYYAWSKGSAVDSAHASFHWQADVVIGDLLAGVDSSGELRGFGPGTGTVIATTNTRDHARVVFYFDPAVGYGTGGQKDILWTCLAVYGGHGLTKRGVNSATEAKGFYTSDIVGYVVDQARGLARGPIATADSLIVAHSVYLDSTDGDVVIGDMSLLMGGWHWGAWEPSNHLIGGLPEVWYTPPPPVATCVVSRYDCEDLDIPKVRLDTLFDTAEVVYRDASGTAARVTVTTDNPYLDDESAGRQLNLDLGIGSAAAATAYGTFALESALLQSRGSGSAILPPFIKSASGGVIPSCELKAGRDRIRIQGLPESGPLTAADTRRFDTFHVRRVELTVDDKGIPRTRVEFDGGGDLMETLNARQAIALTVAGG